MSWSRRGGTSAALLWALCCIFCVVLCRLEGVAGASVVYGNDFVGSTLDFRTYEKLMCTGVQGLDVAPTLLQHAQRITPLQNNVEAPSNITVPSAQYPQLVDAWDYLASFHILQPTTASVPKIVIDCSLLTSTWPPQVLKAFSVQQVNIVGLNCLTMPLYFKASSVGAAITVSGRARVLFDSLRLSNAPTSALDIGLQAADGANLIIGSTTYTGQYVPPTAPRSSVAFTFGSPPSTVPTTNYVSLENFAIGAHAAGVSTIQVQVGLGAGPSYAAYYTQRLMVIGAGVCLQATQGSTIFAPTSYLATSTSAPSSSYPGIGVWADHGSEVELERSVISAVQTGVLASDGASVQAYGTYIQYNGPAGASAFTGILARTGASIDMSNVQVYMPILGTSAPACVNAQTGAFLSVGSTYSLYCGKQIGAYDVQGYFNYGILSQQGSVVVFDAGASFYSYNSLRCIRALHGSVHAPQAASVTCSSQSPDTPVQVAGAVSTFSTLTIDVSTATLPVSGLPSGACVHATRGGVLTIASGGSLSCSGGGTLSYAARVDYQGQISLASDATFTMQTFIPANVVPVGCAYASSGGHLSAPYKFNCWSSGAGFQGDGASFMGLATQPTVTSFAFSSSWRSHIAVSYDPYDIPHNSPLATNMVVTSRATMWRQGGGTGGQSPSIASNLPPKTCASITTSGHLSTKGTKPFYCNAAGTDGGFVITRGSAALVNVKAQVGVALKCLAADGGLVLLDVLSCSTDALAALTTDPCLSFANGACAKATIITMDSQASAGNVKGRPFDISHNSVLYLSGNATLNIWPGRTF